ncbi:MAG: prevent-host-death protein [Treponema sp. GWC1_61_84]|nr:MAG: prevent-host-death protein [Treponema sp. GWC1_61_84]
MIAQITANDLKVKGISAIDAIVGDNDGVVITVRGVEKYVVLPIEEYNLLREFELDAAIQESLKDIAEGKFFTGSIDDHLNRVKSV